MRDPRPASDFSRHNNGENGTLAGEALVLAAVAEAHTRDAARSSQTPTATWSDPTAGTVWKRRIRGDRSSVVVPGTAGGGR